MPTSRLNNVERQYNYPTETVYDEAGQLIKPSKTTYGPRGVRPWYLFDEDGRLVELGFLKKVNLYREKKTANVATQLALIDERLADLTFDGKEYLSSYIGRTKSEAEQKQFMDSIPIIVGSIASIIGTPATGAAVAGGLKLALKSQDTDTGISSSLFKSKINTLEKEANYLLITKNKLSGEYNKLAALGKIDYSDDTQTYDPETLQNALTQKESSSGQSNNTLLYIIIAVVLFIIIRKRRKKR